MVKWVKCVKICITQSSSDSWKHFLIFTGCFSLNKSSVPPFKTNWILTGLQTYCKYLSGQTYRYWTCSDSSKLRLRFCTGFSREEYFTVSSKPSAFESHGNNCTEFLFCGADSNCPLQGYDGYNTLFDLFPCSLSRGQSLQHRVSALPTVLHICLCSPQCTSTYRVAKSVLSWQLCSAFSCSTANSISFPLLLPTFLSRIWCCLVLAQHWAGCDAFVWLWLDAESNAQWLQVVTAFIYLRVEVGAKSVFV